MFEIWYNNSFFMFRYRLKHGFLTFLHCFSCVNIYYTRHFVVVLVPKTDREYVQLLALRLPTKLAA